MECFCYDGMLKKKYSHTPIATYMVTVMGIIQILVTIMKIYSNVGIDEYNIIWE